MKSAEELSTQELKELVAQVAITFQSTIKIVLFLLLSLPVFGQEYMPIPIASANNSKFSFSIHELKQHQNDIWYVIFFTIYSKKYKHQLSSRFFSATELSKGVIQHKLITVEGLELKYQHQTKNPNLITIKSVYYGQDIYVSN